MPDKKNNHFVPRCHFKPFSLNEEGKAINLYTSVKQLLVPRAPVKSQCARDYFYGTDGVLETELEQIEGDYAAAVRRVVAKNDTDDDLSLLRFFSYLQLRRTEIAMKRIKEAEEAMLTDVPEQVMPPPTLDDIMSVSMKSCVEAKPLLIDLRVRIVENRTDIDFVTSDDPAIATNKWMSQRMNAEGFGVMTSGYILIMPLTPRLAVLCYDNQIYTVPTLVAGRVILTKSGDAEALNELQYLKSAANIYFSSWDMGEYVRKQFEEARPRRIEDWFVTRYYLLVDSEKGLFKEVTEEETRVPNSRSIVHSGVRYPVPSRWMSQLKYRDPIKTFSNGTGAGHVRKKEWLKS
ncbi:DUF4238 domain-containing protein [Bradyrhizobium diazoefficiens]|uniref:DUF4238 domain-containing protein n=1 Tax=Bradyrhizobium diazoefficiens TaxID=1355477 RepID=UPI00272B416C|nr:DUF4238 domain-containing protein [Bradyrhizobium diazoefficiens]WLA68544.1 DUF4238 domain-containing protein [Bradyrhizobium diazoefficiens]